MNFKAFRFVTSAGFFSLVLAVSNADAASDAPSVSWHPTGMMHAVLASVVFGFVGIVLAIVGFKLFDLVTPFDLEKEMCENKNVAVGILCAAIILGICHIIAASMS